ncbi:hypothetical protein MtrunA17_Chr3g0140671 [Medicago truncatula]|nr:hypothetical protein MtrunA17_Chr3g0140671 [Medicago truncatula]
MKAHQIGRLYVLQGSTVTGTAAVSSSMSSFEVQVIGPWPFASESVLPSQCPGIHPMHSFRDSHMSILLFYCLCNLFLHNRNKNPTNFCYFNFNFI